MSKTELEELGEDTSGLAQGFSKYADEVKSLTGFDIMVDDTHFKDLYDIFDGISKVWDKLNDTQKARVSEIFGGTRQLQVISSILGNWQDAVKAYGTAMDSAGTATQANSIYMDSFQAHADQLKATFEEFSKDFFDSDFLKGGVDFLKNTLQIIGEIVKNVGALPPLLAIISGFLSARKNIGFFTIVNNDLSHAITGVNQLSNQMGILGRSFADVRGAWAANGFKGVKNVFAATDANFLTALDKNKLLNFASVLAQTEDKALAFRATMQGASQGAVDLARATKGTAEGAQDLVVKVNAASTAERAYTATTIGARIATIALQTAITFGIVLAIQGLITLFQKLKDSIPTVENTTKWLDDSSSKVEESKNKLKDLNDELTTTKKRIVELLNKKSLKSLTVVEQNELDRLERTNAELKRSIVLEKQKLQIAQEKNEAEFGKNVKAQQEESWADQQRVPSWLQWVFQIASNGAWNVGNKSLTYGGGDSQSKFELYLAKAKEVAKTRGDKWQDELKDESEFLSQYVSRLQESLDKLGEYDYNKLSQETQEYVDYVNDSINKYNVLLGNSDTAFNNIYNQQRFDKSQQYLENLKGEGKLTAEALINLYNANGNFTEMVNNMVKVGFLNDTSAQSFELLANQIKNSDNALQEMTNKEIVAILTTQLEELTTQLTNALSAFDTIKSAITEFTEKGALSAKTLSELINLNPEYLNLLTDESGQLRLNSQGYEELMKAKMKDMLITQMKSALKSVLDMKVEEAQAYANAKAYNEQTGSIYDLIGAQLKLSMVEARKKDAANNTTAYSDAVLRTAQMYGALISAVDDYNFSIESAEKVTDQNKAALEQKKKALENNKKALEDNKKALEKQKDALEKSKKKLEDYKSELTDAQSKIKDLIEAVSDYIKQQKEDEKDVLNKRKNAFDELIEKEKEELEIKKKAAEFDKSLSQKENTVAKDALAASTASLDDSSAGRRAQKQTTDALIQSRDELQETLADHEYEIRIAALDKLKEESDKRFDEQIQSIDDYLDNTRQIYNDACLMIQNDTGNLYANLWAYTYTHTTQTKAEFDNMWNSAQAALTRYGVAQYGVIGIMEYLQYEIYNTENQIINLDLRINQVSSSIDQISANIDGVSDSINSLSDSLNNYATQALNNISVGIANVRDEWQEMLKELGEQPKTSKPNPKAVSTAANNVAGLGAGLNSTVVKTPFGTIDTSTPFNPAGLVEEGKKYNAANVLTVPYIYKWDSQKGKFVIDYGATLRSRNLSNVQLNKSAPFNIRLSRYASGTNSAPGGLSLVGEKGAELRILNRGDGVLTNKITKGLAALGANPTQFLADAGRRLLSSIFNSSATPALGAISGNTAVSPEINITIQGDATQSTVNALKEQSNFIIKSAVKQVMSETLARRNISRVR